MKPLPPPPVDQCDADLGPTTVWGGRPDFFLAAVVISSRPVHLRDAVDLEALEHAVPQRDRAGVLRRYARSWKDHTGQI